MDIKVPNIIDLVADTVTPEQAKMGKMKWVIKPDKMPGQPTYHYWLVEQWEDGKLITTTSIRD